MEDSREKEKTEAKNGNGVEGQLNRAFSSDIELKSIGEKTRRNNQVQPNGSTGAVDIQIDKYGTKQRLNQESSLISRLQNSVQIWCEEHGKTGKQALLGALLTAWVGYVIAAACLHFDDSLPLLIGTIVLILGLIYYKVLKPRLITSTRVQQSSRRFLQKVTDTWNKKSVQIITYGVMLAGVVIFLIVDTWDDRSRLVSLAGLLFFIAFLFVFSTNPAQVKWRPVIVGVLLQFFFGLFVLRVSIGHKIFTVLAENVNIFLSYTDNGTQFVYEPLPEVDRKNRAPGGSIRGFLITPPNICGMDPVFAFKLLNTIVFFSCVLAVLYYFGVMQFLIRRIGGFMQWTMGTTAAESMSAAGNIFVGQTESPLLIQPYLAKMTLSEIAAVMTGGFATIAGTVFQVYVSFGACGNHLLSASVMSAPAALAVSKLFYPETEESHTKEDKDLDLGKPKERTFLEAAANGACQGIFLVANIVANLIAFLAFLAFVNASLDYLGALVNIQGLKFEQIMAYVCYPLAFLMGASNETEELLLVGELIGIKTFVNEFVAYKKMGDYVKAGKLSARARLICVYALCGFSNLTAVGIQLGGLGAMCPERKSDFARVAIRALIAGSVACFMTACIAGLLIPEIDPDQCVLIAEVAKNCTVI